MLRFFFTRDKLPTITIPEAEPFDLLSTAEFKNEIIPFSHMYVTSDTFLKQIKLNLPDKEQKIVTVSKQQTDNILNNQAFPPNITEYNIATISEYKALLGNHNEINIVIINGIGADFGDNFIGLAILQRLSNLLAPAKVNFHLMQTFSQRFKEVYENNASLISGNVFIHNNILTIEKFISMNAYIDLSNIRNYKDFGIKSHCTFFTTAFSLENLIPDNNLQPALNHEVETSFQFHEMIESRFEENKPVVLIHLAAYESIKTCPPDFVGALIKSLISQGFNVISPNPIKLRHQNFSDCSDIAKSIQDLTYMISASDCVITIGTLSLNISSALGKPTILLPVTKSSVRTAKHFPEVLSWLTHENKGLYLDTTNNNVIEDKKTVKQIWKNISPLKLAAGMKDFQRFFDTKNGRSFLKNAPKRLAVVIPLDIDTIDSETILDQCLDSLSKVIGFDSLWLNIIDCRDAKISKTHAFNTGISEAIQKDCDYIWFLDPLQLPAEDYFLKALKRFQNNPELAIVAGMQISQTDQKVVWAGSRSSFPEREYKTGNLNSNKINNATLENWVPFKSVILSSKAVIELGLLDEHLTDDFSDIDYCFQLNLRGWSMVFEPKAKSIEVTPESYEPNISGEAKISKSSHSFYKKWSEITGCNSKENLHSEIIKFLYYSNQ